MMKIVINVCFGGFGLSKEAYAELGLTWGKYNDAYHEHDKRTDPKLVAVVEKLGKAANDKLAKLAVVEIPDDVDWVIKEYDGREHVAEKHRAWY